MRKLLLPLILVATFTACVDSDYDLTKVDTSGTTIGDETSVFRIPLAQVHIKLHEIAKKKIDIQALFKEADLWLPKTLPGGVDYVDLTKLGDDAYTEKLTGALIAQMKTDDKKLAAVTDLLWDKYSVEFLPQLGLPGNTSEQVFKTTFMEAFEQQTTLQKQAAQLSGRYLKQINVETLSYDIDRVDIGSDIVDMLCKGLDPQQTPSAQRKNTLHLYGEIVSKLPITLDIAPELTPTNVHFTVPIDAKAAVNEIKESSGTQLFEEDLRQIVEGVTVEIPFTLRRYYPALGFRPEEEPQITIMLRLVKRGGLTINL